MVVFTSKLLSCKEHVKLKLTKRDGQLWEENPSLSSSQSLLFLTFFI